MRDSKTKRQRKKRHRRHPSFPNIFPVLFHHTCDRMTGIVPCLKYRYFFLTIFITNTGKNRHCEKIRIRRSIIREGKINVKKSFIPAIIRAYITNYSGYFCILPPFIVNNIQSCKEQTVLQLEKDSAHFRHLNNRMLFISITKQLWATTINAEESVDEVIYGATGCRQCVFF